MPFAIVPERKSEDPIQGPEGGKEETDQKLKDKKSVKLVNELRRWGSGRRWGNWVSPPSQPLVRTP